MVDGGVVVGEELDEGKLVGGGRVVEAVRLLRW